MPHSLHGHRTRKHRIWPFFVLLALAATLVVLVLGPPSWLPLPSLANAGHDYDAWGRDAEDWDELEAPNYYRVVGPAQVSGTIEPGTLSYEPLDGLGRAQGVRACVNYALMEAGKGRERQSMSDLHPTGLTHNAEVTIELPDGDAYHGFFWNRSHLLAKSLGGEEVIENLICGTRMQNVGSNAGGTEGGMAFPESMARDWLEAHPEGFVHYVATPVYRGRELVCRNVVVDVLSSDGSLDMEIVVFNAAKGFTIDYASGDFWES